MRCINEIKQSAADALRDGDRQKSEHFSSVADPGSVLEMASIIELLLTYVEKSDDLTAITLAKEVRHRLRGDGPEGGV